MLVTDLTLCPPDRLPALVKSVIPAGVDAVQLRALGLPRMELLALACELRSVTTGEALLLINGDAAVAREAGADGVQLGERGPSIAGVRAEGGEGLLIGRSVHAVEGAVAAERDGADLLVLGTVFPSRSHPGGETGGVEMVQDVGRAVSVPVVAIGGISAENAGAVIGAGACGVAVISAILAALDPPAAARALRATVDRALVLRGGAG